jgi:ABC-2 type transport system ATP-binding protein
MENISLQFIQFLIALAVGFLALYIGKTLSNNRKEAVKEIKKIEHSIEEVLFENIDKSSNTTFTPSPLSMIETNNLRKTFTSKKKGKSSTVEAVKGINFSVKRGEIFGLLGPNGAGKTTTMRMLSTLLSPSEGVAWIDGVNLSGDQREIRKRLGYVSQVGGMQRDATGRENLMLQAKLHGMSNTQATIRVEEIIKDLALENFADRKTATYSGGQRRIFDLASGIVHKPTLLFLDEPSTGLDPQNRVHVWEQVKKMHKEGTTIFVTTHYLEEADALCDRVAIVDQGNIVAIGSPAELKQQIAGDIISLEFADLISMNEGAKALSEKDFIKEFKNSDTTLHLYVDKGNENLPTIMKILHDKNIVSQSISLSRPTLDDVFLKITGRSMKEQEI